MVDKIDQKPDLFLIGDKKKCLFFLDILSPTQLFKLFQVGKLFDFSGLVAQSVRVHL